MISPRRRSSRCCRNSAPVLRNIDTAACAERGIKVLHAAPARQHLLRRARLRPDADAGAQARRAERPRHVEAHRGGQRRRYRPFDRRHTPGGNFARVGGTRALNGATIGIIGLGEIGREIALRAQAFGMRVLYHQRTRCPRPRSANSKAVYVPLATLLAESDWIVPQLPTHAGDARPDRPRRAFADQARRLPRQCRRCRRSINRDALIEALRSGRLGGVGARSCSIRSRCRTTTNC